MQVEKPRRLRSQCLLTNPSTWGSSAHLTIATLAISPFNMGWEFLDIHRLEEIRSLNRQQRRRNAATGFYYDFARLMNVDGAEDCIWKFGGTY
jgi:hypothetical protein